ncbi:MAG: toll/interleukin-1 receptor domain-containing protein [Planctomycetota bacterium]|nr:toll/interleukin-1 receptor domain-containing protein [Planctomycetota bacterium]
MSEQYDVFLSHARLDGAWVHALAAELKRLGLRVFLDAWGLRPGELIATGLSEGLERSRFLVLVLSASSVQRDWVRLEWNAFFSQHGPRRLLPVKIDSVAPPAILAPLTARSATGAGRAPTWAIWAWPTESWASRSEPACSLSRHWPSAGKSKTRKSSGS